MRSRADLYAGDIKKAKEAGYHTCQALLMQTKKVESIFISVYSERHYKKIRSHFTWVFDMYIYFRVARDTLIDWLHDTCPFPHQGSDLNSSLSRMWNLSRGTSYCRSLRTSRGSLKPKLRRWWKLPRSYVPHNMAGKAQGKWNTRCWAWLSLLLHARSFSTSLYVGYCKGRRPWTVVLWVFAEVSLVNIV